MFTPRVRQCLLCTQATASPTDLDPQALVEPVHVVHGGVGADLLQNSNGVVALHVGWADVRQYLDVLVKAPERQVGEHVVCIRGTLAKRRTAPGRRIKRRWVAVAVVVAV